MSRCPPPAEPEGAARAPAGERRRRGQLAHAVFITAGYAQAARSGIWHQVGVLTTQYPDMITATAGLGLMCLIGTISIPAGRRRLRGEARGLVPPFLFPSPALSFPPLIPPRPRLSRHPPTP